MGNPTIQVRIDPAIKRQAETALLGTGLRMSDVLRMCVTRIAQDKVLPLGLMVPNETTLAAMRELEAGGGGTAHSVAELMEQLNADD